MPIDIDHKTIETPISHHALQLCHQNIILAKKS